MAKMGSLCLSFLLIVQLLPHTLCFSNGDLRLNGVGASPLVGRLEIYNEGQWGTVCGGAADELASLNFDMGAAHVACRQMGLGFAVNYYSLHHLPQYRLQYGVSNGSIFLRKVTCGDDAPESHLLQCPFYDLGDGSGCDHSMDVVLQCSNVTSPYNGEIRLVPDPSTPERDHTPSSGRLQLHSEGVWRDVCVDGILKSTADSLCRQMGYTGARAAPSVSTEHLQEAWQLAESPIACSSSDVCISECLPQLPVSPRTTSCRAATLTCEFDGAADVNFGGRAKCERPKNSSSERSARLVSPSSDPLSLEGRLEVYVGGVWGSVCQESFSFQEAEVVCKQLGFPYALAVDRVGTTLHFSNIAPAGDGVPIHSVSRCRGIEGHLSECSYPKTRCTSSDHSNDVAVKCSWLAPYGSLALRGRADGTSGASGTLVMYAATGVTPTFYPICDAGFDARHAAVACRQLGYSDGIALQNSYFGSYSNSVGTVLRLSGSCTGSESQLLACPPAMGWDDATIERRGFVPVSTNQSSECEPGQDEVSLHCMSEEIQFRLVGGGSNDRGHLEINYGGTWGRICGSGFGLSEAQVACRHIGYSSVLSVRVDENAASSSNGPVHVSNLSCSGFERSVLHCRFTLESLASSCSTSQDAIWLQCGAEPHPDEGQLRIVGMNETEEVRRNVSGRLEISFNGEWHSLCGQTFSYAAAQVACRELGFANVTHYCTNACRGRGQNDVLVVKEMCSGTERSLKDCPRQEYHTTTCDHSFDIGLECANPLHRSVPSSDIPSPPSGGLPPPNQKNLLIYAVAGGGGAMLIALVVTACLCCLCCHWKRAKKNSEGRWVNTRRSDITQNGHTHLNAVGDMSTMPPIKDEVFDYPKEALDEIGISPHPLAPYDRSLTPPLPLRHHDVILHALSSSSQNSDEDQPPLNHTHCHAHLGQATSEFRSVDGSSDLTVVVVTEKRQSALDHTNREGSPVSFASGPPPNYDEIFQSSSAEPAYVNSCHANRSTGWYEESEDSDSDTDMKKR